MPPEVPNQQDLKGLVSSLGDSPIWKPGSATPGSLVNFNYLFHKPGHPARPTVLITKVKSMKQGYIWGINIQYLTFPYIKKLLDKRQMNACANPGFSYDNIKGDAYIVGAFRQYKIQGIDRLRVLDCSFLLNILGSVRAIDPSQVELIRRQVREQFNRLTNPTAGPSQ